MKLLHPIPSKIKSLMIDKDVDLDTLDKYLNPGSEGTIFHNYSMKLITKLKSFGIRSFIDLKKEFELIQERKSNLSNQLRILVQGHYKFYVDEFEAALNFYNDLTQEQKDSIIDDYYVEEKEDIMKLNLIKINQSIQDTGSVVINKNALINDMNVVHDHYKTNITQTPDLLKSLIDNYDPIEFGTKYLSLMFGCEFDVEESGDNIRLTRIK